MFDKLKIDLEERQRAQWPLLGGIGDIMLDHFNLDTEKGRNFQQQVAKWVSKDNEANAQIKKWQNEQIEQILGKILILDFFGIISKFLEFFLKLENLRFPSGR